MSGRKNYESRGDMRGISFVGRLFPSNADRSAEVAPFSST